MSNKKQYRRMQCITRKEGEKIGHCTNSRPERHTLGSGLEVTEMERVCRYGQIMRDMKVLILIIANIQ